MNTEELVKENQILKIDIITMNDKEFDEFLNRLFEEIHRKYGFYRSKL
jgi:hypothetical protein